MPNNPWEAATPQVDPWEQARKPPPGFEAGPTGAPQIPRGDPLTMASFIESLIGKTPTQKAVTGATAAADVARLAGMLPNPVARTAAAALPIAVGAASEYLQGGSPLTGATTGAMQSVVPNLLARVTGSVLRQKKDVKELTSAVREHLPVLAGEIDRKITTWDKLFRGGEAARIAGKALDATKNKISGALGIKGETFPLLSAVSERQLEKDWAKRQPLSAFTSDQRKIARELSASTDARPFEAWDKEITRLNNKARRFEYDKNPKSAELRKQAYEMTEELTDRIRQVDPVLADEYQLYRRQFHDVSSLERLLSQKGVITSGTLGNKIDMGRLQDLLNDPEYRRAFESSPMGKRFLQEAFRGAPPIGGDVPHEFHARLYGHPSLQHMLPMGGLSGHPSLGSHVGRRIPIPATPFEIIQNWLFSSGQEQ